jgi:hypothetical protein
MMIGTRATFRVGIKNENFSLPNFRKLPIVLQLEDEHAKMAR